MVASSVYFRMDKEIILKHNLVQCNDCQIANVVLESVLLTKE